MKLPLFPILCALFCSCKNPTPPPPGPPASPLAKPVQATDARDLSEHDMMAWRAFTACSKRLSPDCAGTSQVISKGRQVTALGKAPVDGQWRIRLYGDAEGWAFADDLISSEAYNHQDVLRYAVAKQVSDESHEELDRIDIGRTIVFERTKHLRYGYLGDPLNEEALLFLDWGKESLALVIPDARSSSPSSLLGQISSGQPCLLSGTCVELRFDCGTGPCEELSFAATRQVNNISKPDHVDVPEMVRKAWPKAPLKLPLYRLSHLASQADSFRDNRDVSAAFASIWLRRLLLSDNAAEPLTALVQTKQGLAASEIGRLEIEDETGSFELKKFRGSSLLCGKKAKEKLRKVLEKRIAYFKSLDEYERNNALRCSYLRQHDFSEKYWEDEDYWETMPEFEKSRLRCTIGNYRELHYDILYFDRSSAGMLTLRGHASVPMANDHDDDDLALIEQNDQAQALLLSGHCK